MSLQNKQFYEFADFRVDLREKVLSQDGTPVPLTPKVFDTLYILIENSGHLLERDFLINKIWQESFVEESNLTFNIKMLRKALGDDAANPQFIETIPKRGYRFIGKVNKTSGEMDNAKSPSQLNEDNQTGDASPKPRKFPIPVIALAFMIIGTIGVGVWYLRSMRFASRVPVLNSPFISEKLSTNGKVMHAVISTDGKSVVYTNGTGSDKESIWLRQLESGSNVELIPPSDDIYAGIALSPDGRVLYFVRRPKSETRTAVYRVSIFGGVPERIIEEPQGWISISPDGTRISFVRCYFRDDEFCSLWIADSGDGKNEKKLVSFSRPTRIGDSEFAPDLKSIVFAFGQSENAANEFGLMEVDVESGAQREITKERFFNIKNLAWLPDKSGLLITASRIPNKNFRIWQVSLDSGKAEPMTNDSESYSSLSLDKDASRLVSTQVKQDFRLYLSGLENPSSKTILADATLANFTSVDRIVFSSTMSGNDEIWSINADGSGQRQLTNIKADDRQPIGSPESGSIFFASNRTGEIHIWKMNADGSDQTQITQKQGGFPISVSRDGEWVYYHHGKSRTLWRAAAKGGEEQSVFEKGKYYFAVSPDGSQFAYSERKGEVVILVIASLADGQTIQTFPMSDKTARLLEIVWLADGKSIAYTSADSEFANNTLWIQPLNGGMPVKVADLGNEETYSPTFSPDGRKFAVVQGVWKHDAVLLNGFR